MIISILLNHCYLLLYLNNFMKKYPFFSDYSLKYYALQAIYYKNVGKCIRFWVITSFLTKNSNN